MNGIGAHEVIVETPDHTKRFADLGAGRSRRARAPIAIACYDLKRDRRFKYVMIFKNHGTAAGASLEHRTRS